MKLSIFRPITGAVMLIQNSYIAIDKGTQINKKLHLATYYWWSSTGLV